MTHPDKKLISKRFERAMDSYTEHAKIQKRMAAELVGLLSSESTSGMRFDNVLELGAGTGELTRAFLAKFRPNNLTANDLTQDSERFFQDLAGPAFRFLPGDMEQIDFPGAPFDLILSGAAFQWLHDPSAMFQKLARLAAYGGILAFSTFGTDTLREFRAAGATPLAYHNANELTDMLRQAGFEPFFLSESQETIYFDEPLDAIRHLKQTGANAAAPVRNPRKFLREFHRRYPRTTCGTYPLTYHPILILARRLSS